MRIWHFKLRNIRRYAAYLGHCVDCTVKMVNYMQLPIQFTNYFLFPLHKIHLFAIKQQVSLFGI